MFSFFESLLVEIKMTSVWEWIAVVTAVAYVILAARKNILCWIFALLSSAIYVYLCIIGKLYIEAILSLFYVVMAVVGWIAWNAATADDRIHTWKINKHLINITISGVLAYLLGLSFDLWTDQAFPYIDAFTTVFSLSATFMIVRKVLENWIYWIAIDLASIYLYHDRGYTLTSVLFAIYTLLAIVGFYSWRKSYKQQLL
ncbi:MAG: nicotinamide mononucleotide transporter [Flavobacteriaceae bacterium]|jgi:nicotinamide mononucleotide transporter